MSQFDGLLKIKTNQTTEPQPKQRTAKTAKISPANPPPQSLAAAATKQTAKSRADDYTQTSIYIKKETQTAVKKALLDDRSKDFSELVEELLTSWVKGKIRG